LQLQEQQEIRRILAALSALIGAQADRIIRTVVTLAELDLALAKARYADQLRAHEPVLRPIRQTKDHYVGRGTKEKEKEREREKERQKAPVTSSAQPTKPALEQSTNPQIDPSTDSPLDPFTNSPIDRSPELPITNSQLPITNSQLPITNSQLPITNYELPLTNYPLPLTTRSHPGTTIKLMQAMHPLLNQASVVPIDVMLDDSTYALVITGP